MNNELKIDYVDIPSWSSSFVDIGRQIAQCLQDYKDENKMVISIKITANELTEIVYKKTINTIITIK